MSLKERPQPPFDALPSGIEIARYFWHETKRKNNGYNGIDLWREENEYCYLWVEAFVDHDYYHHYLLEIRTHVNGKETRDFLFLSAGIQNHFDVEWWGHPIDFDAPWEEYRDRFAKAMHWFVGRIETTQAAPGYPAEYGATK